MVAHWCTATPATMTQPQSESSPKTFRTVQIQVVHRHGDRSPITPLKDEDYWQQLLVPETIREKIATSTSIVRGPKPNWHAANGRGPFGKLTQVGLYQMVEVGSSLRDRFLTEEENAHVVEDGAKVYPHVWTPQNPLSARTLHVYSTDFERTIQSVQGLLVGLFPDGLDSEIAIDVRHQDIMLPDPHPRLTAEQEELEKELAHRPSVMEADRRMLPLALRVTKVLTPMLAPDAHDVSFGVDQDHPGEATIEVDPLSWNQLAEICKCLEVRDLLPSDITSSDVEDIMKYVAGRWFRNLKHPRLVYLAINNMVSKQVDYLLARTKDAEQPSAIVWSAHDSTLIALLCAYRLSQPTKWPEYASCLVMELIEVTEGESIDYMVRFSLNGEYLNSEWTPDESLPMIPLSVLAERVRTVGAETDVTSSS